MNSVNLNVSGVSTFSGDLRVGVSTLFVDVSRGQIGLGTDVLTGSHLLDVDGDARFAGVSTFSGGLVSDDDATFKGATYNMTWDKSANELNFPTVSSNTGRLIFGSTSYEALELKILSSVPTIQSHNQGITLTSDSGYDITLNSADDIILKNSAQVSQNWYIKCTESGVSGISSVALYAGGNGTSLEKLRTDPGGVIITGVTTSTSGFSCDTVGTGVSLAANVPVTFTGGSGKTLKIYRDASNSYITHESGDFYIQGEYVRIRNAAGTEQIANFLQNGGTTLYHDDSLVFSTDKHGAIVTGIVTATSFSGSGENLTNIKLQETDLWTITADSTNTTWDDRDNDVLGGGSFGVSIARCTTTQNALFAKQGTGMSYSSGVFSFPSTGTVSYTHLTLPTSDLV